MEPQGYLQKEIVRIGREKGYVTVEDVNRLYKAKEIEAIMNKLIILGFFTEDLTKNSARWIYTGK
jgi:hypothetical protein